MMRIAISVFMLVLVFSANIVLTKCEEAQKVIRYSAKTDLGWVLLDNRAHRISDELYEDVVFLSGELTGILMLKDASGWEMFTTGNVRISDRQYDGFTVYGEYIICERGKDAQRRSDLFKHDKMLIDGFPGVLGRPREIDGIGLTVYFTGEHGSGLINQQCEKIYSTHNVLSSYGLNRCVIEKKGEHKMIVDVITNDASIYYDDIVVAFTIPTNYKTESVGSDKYYIATRANKQYVLNNHFKCILSAKTIKYLGNNLFFCCSEERYIISLSDENIKMKVESAYPFTEQLARVKIDGRFGYIDKNMNLVVPAEYKRAFDYQRIHAIVSSDDDKYFVINKRGERVSNTTYNELSYSYHEDIYRFSDANGAGYCSASGETIYYQNGCRINDIYDYENGYGVIRIGMGFYIVDTKGVLVANIPKGLLIARYKDVYIVKDDRIYIYFYSGESDDCKLYSDIRGIK